MLFFIAILTYNIKMIFFLYNNNIGNFDTNSWSLIILITNMILLTFKFLFFLFYFIFVFNRFSKISL